MLKFWHPSRPRALLEVGIQEGLLEVGIQEGLLEVGIQEGLLEDGDQEGLLEDGDQEEELLEVGNRGGLLWADGHWHAGEGPMVYVLFAASLIGFLYFVSFRNVLRIRLSGDEEQY